MHEADKRDYFMICVYRLALYLYDDDDDMMLVGHGA